MSAAQRDWVPGRSAQVKEEPAQRAGDTEQSAQAPSLHPPMPWHIGGRTVTSRFLLGTAGYPSPAVLQAAIGASGAQVVTVGLRRQLATGAPASDFFEKPGLRDRGSSRTSTTVLIPCALSSMKNCSISMPS